MSKSQKEPKVFKAVYMGRRLTNTGKVRQVFKHEHGEEMCFSGVCGVYIGLTYECGKGTIAKRPLRIDVERIDNPEWVAADALIDANNAVKRAEIKIAKLSKSRLTEAMESLRPLLRGLDYFERRSLVELLISRVKK